MLYFLWTERAKRNKFFDDVYRGKTIQLRNKLARLNLSVDDTNSVSDFLITMSLKALPIK